MTSSVLLLMLNDEWFLCYCSVTVMNGGLVGLSLTYAIGLMGLFQWGVRQSAEVENQVS